MLVGRVIGWVLLLSAGSVVVLDLFLWFAYGHRPPLATGEFWHLLSPSSQAGFQRSGASRAPWLWDDVAATILLWPSELALAIPGLFLIWVCRERDGRKRRP
jgi:hypothetical protein